MAGERNHYKTLGLLQTATKEDIRTKYRALVLKYHPDINKSEEANAIFLSLKEAFEILSDDENRRVYDQQLRVRSAPLFRSERWPSPPPRDRYSSEKPFAPPYMRTKINVAEWERMHYGIGQPLAGENGKFWPTGEKTDQLNDHQLYFRRRAQRLMYRVNVSGGGKNGGGGGGFRGFCTKAIISVLG